LRILGESAARDANLGEALTMEANGVVTSDAKAAFSRALTLDDTSVSARYYLGLAAEQDGDRDAAAKMWRDLIAQAPAGAFWIGGVREALARVEGNSNMPMSAGAARLPAVASIPPGPQGAMISGMVDRLAARLRQDGSDVDGWVRLIRSYQVLGDPEKMAAATADARQALAGGPDKLRKLAAALQELAVSNGGSPERGAVADVTEAAGAGAAPPAHEAGAMVQGMVQRLADRLKTSGSDPEGWLMLVRSYETLGDKDKAAAAVHDARDALAGDRDKLEQFNAALGKIQRRQ
jgi:cytochrome c-type biogenesis protein CcmH